MSRLLPEWVGKTDDTAIPDRVRLRVWDKAQGHCALCTRKIVAEKWECDHKIPLIDPLGKNAESNLQVLCMWCHKRKTADDVAIKSYHYRRRLAHAGIKRRKSRPMPFGKNDHFKKKVTGEVVARRLRIKW